MTFKADNAITKTTWRKGVKHQQGIRNNQAKLDEVTVRMIRASSLSCKVLGKRLGLHEETVYKARVRITWKHVA